MSTTQWRGRGQFRAGVTVGWGERLQVEGSGFLWRPGVGRRRGESWGDPTGPRLPEFPHSFTQSYFHFPSIFSRGGVGRETKKFTAALIKLQDSTGGLTDH